MCIKNSVHRARLVCCVVCLSECKSDDEMLHSTQGPFTLKVDVNKTKAT